MDDREWQTFVTVVDEGNITRAAENYFYRNQHLAIGCAIWKKP